MSYSENWFYCLVLCLMFIVCAVSAVWNFSDEKFSLLATAGPQVTVRTRQESVRRGESVILRCEAEGDAPLDLSWRVRDSKIDPNYDVRFVLELIMRLSRESSQVWNAHTVWRKYHSDAALSSCITFTKRSNQKQTKFVIRRILFRYEICLNNCTYLEFYFIH